jgi:hypothetical protein
MRVSIGRIAVLAVGFAVGAATTLYASNPMTEFDLSVFDWQAASTIATLLAVVAAIWVGLQPELRARKERASRARIFAVMVLGEIEVAHLVVRGILGASETRGSGEFDLRQAQAITTYYAQLNVSTLAGHAQQIHVFDELLAEYLAEALASVQTVKALLAPFGLDLAVAAAKPIAASDVREAALPLAQSLDLARTGLCRLLGRKEDEDQLKKSIAVVSDQILGQGKKA